MENMSLVGGEFTLSMPLPPALSLLLSLGACPTFFFSVSQVSLCNLLVLSLKGCRLQKLGEDIAELGCLRELYLESNRILRLPDTFTRLRTLEVSYVKL